MYCLKFLCFCLALYTPSRPILSCIAGYYSLPAESISVIVCNFCLHLLNCKGQTGGRRGKPDDEVNGGGSGVKEYDAVSHKREGVPESSKSTWVP